MTGDIQYRLMHCKDILLQIARRKGCVKITGYDPSTIRHFVEAIDRVLARYQKESERVRRYGRV